MIDTFLDRHHAHPTIHKLINYFSNTEFNNPIMKKLKEIFAHPEFINPITIDLHSHLLPGIDDGVRTMEESLKLIKKFKSLGYTKLITTPHIISDSYPNTKKIIQNKLLEVQKAVKEANIDIIIEAGAEHYIDMDFLDLIEKDELVPFCNNYILFETSYISKPVILEKAIFDMQAKGYIPVLAHPERYKYMHSDISNYKKLKDIGVLFQVNTKSLSRSSGSVYEMALKLLDLGFIDFMGSDAHRMHDLVKFEEIMNKRIYKRVFDNNNVANMSTLKVQSTYQLNLELESAS
ncbi:MAG: capsular biosynthesis protein [Sulfurovum sp.]|nr:MAG: capsular biosynthesis protein [Sulfurovum sp.]